MRFDCFRYRREDFGNLLFNMNNCSTYLVSDMVIYILNLLKKEEPHPVEFISNKFRISEEEAEVYFDKICKALDNLTER